MTSSTVANSENVPVLSAKDLVFGYSEGCQLLSGIDFSLYPGQSLGLEGGNGSGKTTLFRCLTGLNSLWSGEIYFNGQKVKTEKEFIRLRRSVVFSLQNAEDQLFFATALEDLSFGPLNQGLTQSAANELGMKWLAKVGLDGMGGRKIGELSGGQQKLLALAGVFAMEPDVLLLDEPFNGLDEKSVNRVTAILSETPSAKIIVCHDRLLIRKLCPEVLKLEKGKLTPAASN